MNCQSRKMRFITPNTDHLFSFEVLNSVVKCSYLASVIIQMIKLAILHCGSFGAIYSEFQYLMIAQCKLIIDCCVNDFRNEFQLGCYLSAFFTKKGWKRGKPTRPFSRPDGSKPIWQICVTLIFVVLWLKIPGPTDIKIHRRQKHIMSGENNTEKSNDDIQGALMGRKLHEHGCTPILVMRGRGVTCLSRKIGTAVLDNESGVFAAISFWLTGHGLKLISIRIVCQTIMVWSCRRD